MLRKRSICARIHHRVSTKSYNTRCFPRQSLDSDEIYHYPPCLDKHRIKPLETTWHLNSEHDDNDDREKESNPHREEYEEGKREALKNPRPSKSSKTISSSKKNDLLCNYKIIGHTSKKY